MTTPTAAARPTALIVDLDDTQVLTWPIYAAIEDAVVGALVRETGAPEPEVRAAVRAVRAVSATTVHPTHPEQYSRGLEAGALAICHAMAGDRPQLIPYATRMAEVRREASRIMTDAYPLLPGTLETLEAIRAAGLRAICYTQGVAELQTSKIDRHGLGSYFERVVVVAQKNAETLDRLLSALALDRATTWVVGDSRKSDIAPAAALGLTSVWITPSAEEAAFGRAHDGGAAEPTYTIPSFAALWTVCPALRAPELSAG